LPLQLKTNATLIVAMGLVDIRPEVEEVKFRVRGAAAGPCKGELETHDSIDLA
jgi:hypothetical protein